MHANDPKYIYSQRSYAFVAWCRIMDLDFFKNKKVTVFGLGLHGGGIGIVEFLSKKGAKVVVTDLKTKEELRSSLEKLKGLKNVEYVLGQHRSEDFIKTDMIIKNPVIPWDNQNIKLALKNNIPVEMDSSLFFKLCKNPIIGITGTKGKTTTSTMIYEMLRACGKNPVRVGVGQIPVLNRLDLLEKNSVVVFELSSWRLSALGRIKSSPYISVVTNILPDHLNYYKSMKDYVADKKNIFLYQKNSDWLVINNDSEVAREFPEESSAKIIKFSENPLKEGNSIFIEDGAIYLNNGIDAKKLMELKNMKIKGVHNIFNMMAAIGAVYAFGIPFESIKKCAGVFKGIPHRLEFVREIGGVKFYNDTAATVPDAAICALNSFSEPIVLIAGGTDKKLDFAEFGKEIIKRVKNLILIKGTATEKLVAEIRKNSNEEKFQNAEIVDSMEKAVESARKLADSGDVILLSPGAASFGLFLNEFDRGDKFKETVKKLK